MEKKTYRPYNPKQMMLLPPSLDEWLPQDHMARFIDESIDELDISEIQRVYEQELRGYPPYHPRMMLKILIYGYCTGVRSSRKLAKKCVEDVAFRYLAANNFPDFRTISDFRQRHLASFKALFLEVLLLCRQAGIGNLGKVSLDGSKIKANASKHKAMSYGRMKSEEERLMQEIEKLIAQAQRADCEDDEKYGKDKTGDEVPEELKYKESRLKKIREAKAALEKKAAEKKKIGDSDPPKPDDTDQHNFTDPESGIMPSSSEKKSFVQAYNAQIAVNEHQVILANGLSAETSDCKQLPGMIAKIRSNNGGLPEDLLADAGYFSNKNVLFAREFLKINAIIPPDKQKHGSPPKGPATEPGPKASPAEMMRWLLKTEQGRALYATRKITVEPVFGQIKRCMGFSQFSLRGIAKTSGEWDLVCLCHNLRKLFTHRLSQAQA